MKTIKSACCNADAKKVFVNICNIAGWWTTNIEGSSNKLNDVFTVHFGDTFVTFKVTEFASSCIVWLVTESWLPWLINKKEWDNNKICWKIFEKVNPVKITMTHDGLIPAVECYENCEKGWNFFEEIVYPN